MKTFHVFYTRAEHIGNINVRLRDIREGRGAKVSNYSYIALVRTSSLDNLFREMNIVDGNELPLQLRCRSMIVGDIVIDPKAEKGWVCDMIGWKELDADTTKAFFDAVPTLRA